MICGQEWIGGEVVTKQYFNWSVAAAVAEETLFIGSNNKWIVMIKINWKSHGSPTLIGPIGQKINYTQGGGIFSIPYSSSIVPPHLALLCVQLRFNYVTIQIISIFKIFTLRCPTKFIYIIPSSFVTITCSKIINDSSNISIEWYRHFLKILIWWNHFTRFTIFKQRLQNYIVI